MSAQNDVAPYQAAFFIVPSRIMNLSGLTLTYLKVYETIFQFINHGKECYLSTKSIMLRTGIESDATVRKALIFFEKNNELKRITKNGKRYFTQPSQQIETDLHPSISGTPPQHSRNAPPSILGTHNNNNINTKNNNKSFKSLCASDDARAQSFDIFWKTYLKKKNKKDAYKIWRRLPIEVLPKILEKLKAQNESEIEWKNQKYIPLASNYLKNERWQDEITNIELIENKPEKFDMVATLMKDLNLNAKNNRGEIYE